MQGCAELAAQHSPPEVTRPRWHKPWHHPGGVPSTSRSRKPSGWRAGRVQAAPAAAPGTPPRPHVEQGDAQQALRAVFVAHVAFAQAHPACRLVFQELQRAPFPLKDKVRQLMQRCQQLLTGLLEPARPRYGPSPASMCPQPPCCSSAPCRGLVMQSLIGEKHALGHGRAQTTQFTTFTKQACGPSRPRCQGIPHEPFALQSTPRPGRGWNAYAVVLGIVVVLRMGPLAATQVTVQRVGAACRHPRSPALAPWRPIKLAARPHQSKPEC